MNNRSPQLVECVPNFSEGRRPQVIDAIVSAIAGTGVHLLDVSSDADHNRTVVTFAAQPAQIVDGAFAGIRAAAELIDLTQHQGVHPRIGAADVVPFVPLRGVTITDCAALARELGERVGRDLRLPVFLYGAAAADPARYNLADIRRGGYECLQARINDEQAMQPDYGSTSVGAAGAVVVGAREPLIAYNLYLNTDDVAVAKAIARAVRASSGGLTNVKALGLLVDGRAQVSINLTDFRKTGLHTVTQAVRAEAEKHEAAVVSAELVGLMPQAALIDAARAYLGLPPEVAALTLEKRLGNITGNYREIAFE